MKGFIVFNNKQGSLLYSKYFNEEQKLSKESGFTNLVFDKQDPMKIASQFFALMKMTELMAEEYKEEYPEVMDKDPNARMAFHEGFTSYQSDSVDYILQHNDQWPLTLVLFFDQGTHEEDIMRAFAIKLMDVFLFKFEKRLKKAQGLQQEISKSQAEEFEFSLPLVLENVSCSPHSKGARRLRQIAVHRLQRREHDDPLDLPLPQQRLSGPKEPGTQFLSPTWPRRPRNLNQPE